jgi:hypothetical protein
MMGAVGPSEILVTVYQTKWHYISEDIYTTHIFLTINVHNYINMQLATDWMTEGLEFEFW